MMEFDAFSELVDEIMARGHDEETAARFARLIGDLPITDEHGNVIVRDEDNRELARLPLKFFNS